MTQKTSPFVEASYGWDQGESNWNFGMDQNLLKFSFLFDRNIEGIVETLPAVVNGTAYFNTVDNKIYFAVEGAYYTTSVPKWFEVVNRADGIVYRFTGTALEVVENTQDVFSKLSSSSDGQGDSLIAVKQPALGAATRTQHDKNSDFYSLSDFAGADSTGVNLSDGALVSAQQKTTLIYVPAGTWRISKPSVINIYTRMYGPGVLKFDRAEWYRSGGSAGTAVTNERFTLFFQYTSQADVFCEVDGVSQPISWVNDVTFEVPAPPADTKVIYGVNNGTLPLGPVAESVFQYGMFSQVPPKHAPVLLDTYTSRSFNCTSYGARALQNLVTGSNNTAIGSRALESTGVAGNNTGVGFQALYRATGGGNTGVGSACAEWLTTGEFNSFLGQNAGSKVVTGSYNVGIGYQALGESANASYAVAVGHRALGNSGTSDVSNNVAVGTFAGDFMLGQQNVAVGYRAANGPNEGSDGAGNVSVGWFSMRNQAGADYNVAIGNSSGVNMTSGQSNVLVGYQAGNAQTTANNSVLLGYQAGFNNTASGLVCVGYQAGLGNTIGTTNIAIGNGALTLNSTGSMNTAIGAGSLSATTGGEGTAVGYNALLTNSTGIYNTAMGSRSLRLSTTGSNNTAIGRDALYNNTTGGNNTAVGVDALKIDQTGGTQTTFGNTTGIGFGASVSASNQVQLGNSATTTYVYGTVQNRSDIRDKADIVETSLGLDFIKGLRPVEGRWDMREDYFEESEDVLEDGEVVTTRKPIEKDGSKKRSRLHQWFIAQEVKELCDRLGVEFGGYQDHSVSGGCDVLSLGYDEFIPPIVSALQDVIKRQDGIEKRLLALEAK